MPVSIAAIERRGCQGSSLSILPDHQAADPQHPNLHDERRAGCQLNHPKADLQLSAIESHQKLSSEPLGRPCLSDADLQDLQRICDAPERKHFANPCTEHGLAQWCLEGDQATRGRGFIVSDNH